MDADQIRRSIAAALSDSDCLSPEAVSDIAFHMTDWVDDLESLVAFYEQPGMITPEQIDELLGMFLVHAPNHLAAAVKLYTGEPLDDVFHIGATLGNGLPSGTCATDSVTPGNHPTLPAGGHTAYECGWERDGDSLTLWCPLHVGLQDLGVFVAYATPSTHFVVDGHDRSMDEALSRYGELWGDTILIAGEGGQLRTLMFGTRTEG